MSVHTSTQELTISKVYKHEGTKDGRAWTRFDIYFEGSDHKFGWFQKDGVVPNRGGKVLGGMEYEVVQSGEYTNYNIKKLELDAASLAGNVSTGTTHSNNVSNNTLPNSSCTMFIAYAKDILDSKIMAGGYKDVDFRELNELYVQEGMRGFYRVQDWLKTDMAMEGAKKAEEKDGDSELTPAESEEFDSRIDKETKDLATFPGDF